MINVYMGGGEPFGVGLKIFQFVEKAPLFFGSFLGFKWVEGKNCTWDVVGIQKKEKVPKKVHTLCIYLFIYLFING